MRGVGGHRGLCPPRASAVEPPLPRNRGDGDHRGLLPQPPLLRDGGDGDHRGLLPPRASAVEPLREADLPQDHIMGKADEA